MEARPPARTDLDDFVSLYRRELHSSIALAAALTGDRRRACDLVARAFALAEERWDDVGRLTHPAGWVRRTVISLTAAAAPPTPPGDAADSVSHPFWTAAQSVPPGERAVLALHHLGGLSPAEIAVLLEIRSERAATALRDAHAAMAASIDTGASIEELGRLAAEDLWDEVAALAIGLGGGVDPPPATETRPPARVRRRQWVTVAAAGAVGLLAAIVLVIVLVTRGGSSDEARPSDSATAGGSLVVPSPPASPATTTPTPTSAPPASTSPVPSAPEIAVSHLSPPPLVEPAVIAGFEHPAAVEGSTQRPIEFGVAPEGWIAVDSNAATATVYDRAATALRTIPLEVVPFPFVVGADGALYGLDDPAPGRLVMIAIPLDGLGAGQVVARTPVLDTATYADLPAGALGLGADGIVDRLRNVGEVLMPYLALDGVPVTVADAVVVSIDAADTVRQLGGPSWQLAIERTPGWTVPADRTSLPAASPTGAVFVTTIGPAAVGGQLTVIASLLADGTGSWSSLPDGWTIAAGDRSGTLLRRDITTGPTTVVEVAWFP